MFTFRSKHMSWCSSLLRKENFNQNRIPTEPRNTTNHLLDEYLKLLKKNLMVIFEEVEWCLQSFQKLAKFHFQIWSRIRNNKNFRVKFFIFMSPRSLSRYSNFSSIFLLFSCGVTHERKRLTKANPVVFWSATQEGVMCALGISLIELEKTEIMWF